MKYNTARVQRTADTLLLAADMLHELSKLLPSDEPLSTTSGLSPQPAAVIDQLSSISYAHSAAALAAIASIRGVVNWLRDAEVVMTGEARQHSADVLTEALALLGVRS